VDLFKIAKERTKVIQAYRDFFASPTGKIILDDLMSECNFAKPTIDSTDRETFFNEGKRNVFLYILTKATIDPKEVFKRIVTEGQSIGEENDGN